MTPKKTTGTTVSASATVVAAEAKNKLQTPAQPPQVERKVTRRSSTRTGTRASTANTTTEDTQHQPTVQMPATLEDTEIEDENCNNNDEEGDDDNLLGDLPDMNDVDDDDDEEDEEDEKQNKGNTAEGGEKDNKTDEEKKVSSIFVPAGNGLMSGDDYMLPEDIERRKTNKLFANGKIPYFEGDYWPQEAEELAKERKKELDKELEKRSWQLQEHQIQLLLVD